MPTKRSASLSLKQASGILVLGIGLLFLLATFISIFVSIFQLNRNIHPEEFIPAIVGITIGMALMLGFCLGIFLIALYLLKDPHGMDWKKWRP